MPIHEIFKTLKKKKASQKRKADEANEELELIHNKDSEDEEKREISHVILPLTVKKHRFSAKSINIKLEKPGISVR